MTNAELNLAVLDGLVLKEGGHKSPKEGACLMEAVAYVAGEPWSADPKCSSPILNVFGRQLNDSLPDDRRQELVSLVLMLVGSRGDEDSEEVRNDMLGDWYVREHLPRLLRHAKLDEQAERLAALPPVTEATTPAAVAAVREAARAARDAWNATFDLAAEARARAQGVVLSGETIAGLMAPVVEELWREQIALFRRLILAGPHGDHPRED
jgi:hypothetical protein